MFELEIEHFQSINIISILNMVNKISIHTLIIHLQYYEVYETVTLKKIF